MNKLNIYYKDPLGTAKGIFCFNPYIFLFFSLTFLSSVSFSQAKLEVTDAKKNFGIVKRGEVVKNEYEIRNAGNQPLLITDIEIACSCTSADYTKQPILPGQKTTVLVTFNTASVYGRQDRVVVLKSNDPEGSSKLRFKGFVQDKK